MSINHDAVIFKGYLISDDTLRKRLDEKTIESLMDANILHALNYCYDENNYIFGYATALQACEGSAIVLRTPFSDPCQENKENENLMQQALELFPGDLPHTYPKYYLASVVY